LRVDGGASANDLLMQIQSDLAALPISRGVCVETTASGVAMMAGLALGVYQSTAELLTLTTKGSKLFTPQLSEETRAAHLEKWHKAILATKAFT